MREVATQARPFVCGDQRPVDGVLGMGEDTDARRFLLNRLARMWIDPAHFTDHWLAEGLSAWLATQVLDGASCIPPEAHPGPGTPDLDIWTEVTSTELIPRGNWQQNTACSLVAAGAEIIGTERMVELTSELIGAAVPRCPWARIIGLQVARATCPRASMGSWPPWTRPAATADSSGAHLRLAERDAPAAELLDLMLREAGIVSSSATTATTRRPRHDLARFSQLRMASPAPQDPAVSFPHPPARPLRRWCACIP